MDRVTLKSIGTALPFPLRGRIFGREESRVGAVTRPTRWGWLPALSLLGAFGLLLVAIANLRWRSEQSFSIEMFWLGLLVLYVPVALRLIMPEMSREERIGLIIGLALALYGVKMFNSPLAFKNFDEFLHVRTATDIIRTNELFSDHPVLPASPLYPGMENIVSALHEVGGINVFTAGAILIGVGRVVFVISLYVFYRRISGSERLASIATLLYMANPSFVFFDAMFAYESLALPFAALVLFTVSRWLYTRNNHPLGLTLVMMLAMLAVIVTHHLTTYAMLAILLLWSVVDTVFRYLFKDNQPHLGWAPTAFALVASAAWVLYVATITVGYLAPEIASAVQELLNFAMGEAGGRELFSTPVGTKPPIGERLSGFAAVGLIVLIMPLGLWHIWLRHRRNIPVVVLGLGSLSYPITQAFRVVHIKGDLPGRAVEFVFIALAFVLAIGLVEFVLPRLPHRVPVRFRYLGLASTLGLMFIGGVVVGWKPLPPGSYMVIASTRSVDELSITTAEWTRTGLGPDRRIGSDRINGLLAVVYGQQHQVTLSEEGIWVPNVFFAPVLTPQEEYILWEGQIEYLVVDRRLSEATPFHGFYFEQSEPNAFQHTAPIAPEALAKFDDRAQVNRVFDNGTIRIYDVRAIWNAPQ